jgi:integrase
MSTGGLGLAKRGWGEGTIYQRSDGRWEGRVNTGGAGSPRRRPAVYGRTRAEVAAKMIQLARERQLGNLPGQAAPRLDEFTETWLKTIAGAVRPRTLASDRFYTRKHLLPELGRLRLSRITVSHVQSLLQSKLEAGMAPQSVVHIRSVLRRILNHAIRLGLLNRSVASLARPPRLEHFEIHPFTPDEARAFLHAIEGDRLRALYVVALFAGLRQGELLGLKWEDVDLDAGMIRVNHALQRVDGRLRLVPPKTASSRRSVLLPPMAVEVLRQHKAAQLEDRLSVGPEWGEGDLVFTTRLGAPIEPRNATRSFKRALAQAALREIRFHDLRHSCATLLLVQGVAPRVVMEILGHSQIAVTMNTYSHVLPVLQREAAGQLEALLAPRT